MKTEVVGMYHTSSDCVQNPCSRGSRDTMGTKSSWFSKRSLKQLIIHHFGPYICTLHVGKVVGNLPTVNGLLLARYHGYNLSHIMYL